ncbi:MAG: mannose-1-phosphate guanylyltransferase/mannose-6-phosphate isomerase [Oceanobacter sp.]|nr:MAG: mannose-1-phosphate guanylyltransferase/mannose-6-phosphate isomerase [Oceanobacter sp.]
MMIPVIMAGGSGTRLWPLSRTAFPKQFLSLGYDQTMLQQTLARLNGLSDVAPIVISNEEHRFLVAEQLRQMNTQGRIMLEPVGRNTAPAIALAAFQALRDSGAGDVDSRLRGNDEKKSGNSEAPVLLVLAADHVIKDTAAFQKAAAALLPEVQAGKFGTLGIVPTEAATGYGYIKAGNESAGLYAVEQFVEKPDAATAQAYLDSGKYYWNSGMFMVRADRYLEELKRFSPEMYAACDAAMANTESDFDFVRVDADAFKACPDDSIDYAVMEPLCSQNSGALEGEPQVVVAPLDAGWSDVGSWSALWEIAEKCEHGNAVLHAGKGTGDTILNDSRNSLVSTSDRLVTTLGVDDLVIVDTKDALLVAHKDKVQDVKKIVAEIKARGGQQHHQHREVYRPWGIYDSIDNGERYQVKRITVKPGAKLSVQMHHHRAEHWVVVSGTAKVTNGDDTFLVTENESTYIPIGQIHALENPGKVELEMIEVQSGSYLGEDDIVRFEDKYGRA